MSLSMPPTLATRLRWPAFALAIASALSGCGGVAARYASYLERGKQFLAENNLDKAGVEIRNALQVEPTGYEALYLYGRLSEQRGAWRDAVAAYQASIEAHPDNPPARAGLGKLYIMSRLPDRALQTIEPDLRAHPDNADLLVIRAAAENLQKKASEARADAEHAFKLDPTNESVVALLAALYQQAGDTSHALEIVTEAVKRAPQSTDLRQVLANLYLTTNQPDGVVEQIRRIIALHPKDLAPRLQLAQFLVRMQKMDEAQRTLETAVVELPQNDAAKLALADLIASHRSRAEGEQTLRSFIAKEPDNDDLRFGLAALLQRAGSTAEAITAYREIIGRDGLGPKGLIARDSIAALELSTGHPDRAQALVKEVLDKNPRDNDALVLRANIELGRNDPTPAIADLRAALRDQPQSVALRRTLARAYLAKSDTALAEESLRAAEETAPNDPAVKMDLAQLFLQTGRVGQAVPLLEELVRRAPDNAQAREQLVRAYLDKDDLPAARRAADDLKTLRPDSAAAFYLSGRVAQGQNRLEDSAREYQHALEIESGYSEALAALTHLDMGRGKGPQAVARLRAIADRGSPNESILELLGETCLVMKDFVQATQAFTRAATTAPSSWAPHRDLALVKLAQNDVDGAVAEYESALRVSPLQPQLVVEVASLDEHRGRADAAIARYEALLQGNPGSRQLASNNLAMLLVTYRKDRASLDRARDLTATFGAAQNSSLLDTQGWVRFKRGEYTEALAALERAIARAPDSKIIRFHLAMTELQLGQREQARSDLEAALSGSGTFAGAEEARVALASLGRRAG